MKSTTRITATKMVCIIAALANAPVNLADTFSGTLGAGNENIEPTDVYALTCPVGTASVRARAGSSVAEQISVQVINPNGLVNSVISQVAVSPKPTAVLAGRAGNYLVTVHKSPTLSPVTYSITLDCHKADRIAFSGTQSVLVQNQ